MSACSDKSAVMTSDRLALQNRNLGVIKEFGYLFERDQRWQGNPNLNVLDKKYHFFTLSRLHHCTCSGKLYTGKLINSEILSKNFRLPYRAFCRTRSMYWWQLGVYSRQKWCKQMKLHQLHPSFVRRKWMQLITEHRRSIR